MNPTPMNTKKSWTKPQLLVLVRNNPEEAVLDSCKRGQTFGPSNSVAGCTADVIFCYACYVPASS